MDLTSPSRHQLIAQPEHHALPPSPPSGDGPSRTSGSGSEGIFQHFFGSMMGGGSGSTSNPNSARSVGGRSSNLSDGRSQRNRGGSSSDPGRQSSEDHHLPGGWDNELD